MVMAYIVMAYIVMAYIVMACIVMAYVTVVYVVMAYVVMALTISVVRNSEATKNLRGWAWLPCGLSKRAYPVKMTKRECRPERHCTAAVESSDGSARMFFHSSIQ